MPISTAMEEEVNILGGGETRWRDQSRDKMDGMTGGKWRYVKMDEGGRRKRGREGGKKKD